jgi:hypothetical protein
MNIRDLLEAHGAGSQQQRVASAPVLRVQIELRMPLVTAVAAERAAATMPS